MRWHQAPTVAAGLRPAAGGVMHWHQAPTVVVGLPSKPKSAKCKLFLAICKPHNLGDSEEKSLAKPSRGTP